MYCEWVDVDLGQGFQVRVFVSGVPGMSKEWWQMRARSELLAALAKPKVTAEDYKP